MTTIGKELKKIRTTYGLTQREMSAGVLKPTYYGLIEQGLRKISINDLLEILKRNGISIYEFFGAFDQKEVQQRHFENQIQMACLTGDEEQIETLLKLDKIKANRLQSLQLQLIKAEISGGVKHLPVYMQKRMRRELLHIGEWNRKTLWELLITMPLFDQEEVTILMTSVLEQKTRYNSTIELFAAVLVAYTDRLYNEGDFTEVKKFIKLIKSLPTKPTLMMYKVLAIYYSNLLDEDSHAKKITRLLKLMNYHKFLEAE